MKRHPSLPLLPWPNGFSIAEVLVGTALLALSMVGAAALVVNTTTTRKSTELNDQRQALIDNDIALIQERARLYTWCNSAARVTDANCNDEAPGSEDYYSVDCSLNNVNCNTFRNACVNGQIAAPLREHITKNLAQTQLDTVDLARTVAVDDPQEHRLVITYTSTGDDAQVIRRMLLVPPVASWCPV